MQSKSLRVVRSSPRLRNSYTDLCGYLDVSVIVDGDSLSFFHIGSGRKFFKPNIDELKKAYLKLGCIHESLIDRIKIEKDYDEFASTTKGIVIPGSSIKGNVRSRIELSFKGYEGTVDSCFINAGKPLIGELTKGTSGWRHYRIWGEVLFEDRGVPCNFTVMDEVCLVCDLFGTYGLKSLIDFSDFECVNASIKHLDLPFGISVQAVPAGSEFRGRIDFKNLKDYELGLLLLGMGIEGSHEGRRTILGRFKYRGTLDSFKFGKVRYRVNELKLSQYSKTLSSGGIDLQPDSSAKGDLLSRLCKSLTDLTLKKFQNRFRIINEVEILDRLL
ncbi:hypothetical protein KEJ27_09225 [Candidatus Bathyarchaeota archaeon]|nr:hypothetical protein [Candidatus Bathyarchaeota archaeon]MBS7613542.1 hypothetical protein [Candidatus Bathyarchaeota archaeon]